jgi:hypothetical protein
MRDESTSVYRDVLRYFKDNNDYLSALSSVGDGLLLASKAH